MRTIHVTIRGTTAMLMNRFTEEAQAKASEGTSRRGQEHDPAYDDAEGRLYRLDGQIYVPAEWVRQSCVAAAGYHKIGRRSAAVAAAAGILIQPEALIIDPQTWEVDSRPVTIPATRGRILRHRPKFPEGYTIGFDLKFDADILPGRDLVRNIVDDAGSKVGIGDWRPAKRGPFGRFEVVLWEE